MFVAPMENLNSLGAMWTVGLSIAANDNFVCETVGNSKKNKGDRAGQYNRFVERKESLKDSFFSGTYIEGTYAKEFVCVGCKKTCPNWRKEIMTYCSRSCFGSSRKLYANKQERKEAERARAKERKGVYSYAPKKCIVCPVTFIPNSRTSKICSDTCKKIHARKATLAYDIANDNVDRTPRPCKECDRIFAPIYGSKLRDFCSNEHSKRYNRRVGKAVRRARLSGAVYVRFDPIDVLDRDGWRCYICGIETPRTLRGTHEDNAPELEHLIALANGGDHTPENTACACRKCNGLKSDNDNIPINMLVKSIA